MILPRRNGLSAHDAMSTQKDSCAELKSSYASYRGDDQLPLELEDHERLEEELVRLLLDHPLLSLRPSRCELLAS